jgi:ring-1,2-phenylacetyl-CoA epoxidase subunit PaaE
MKPFEMSQKQTILDAALSKELMLLFLPRRNMQQLPCRVTSGTAEMKKNSILTDKEIADGLILSCQAHPTSESIYVDFDDV